MASCSAGQLKSNERSPERGTKRRSESVISSSSFRDARKNNLLNNLPFVSKSFCPIVPILDRARCASEGRTERSTSNAATRGPFAGFIGAGLNFITQQRLMWYILFVVYAPYAMLPLPLRWCVLAGYGTALTHMVMAGISLLQDSTYVRRQIVDSHSWNIPLSKSPPLKSFI